MEEQPNFIAIKNQIQKIQNIEKYIAAKNSKELQHSKKWTDLGGDRQVYTSGYVLQYLDQM